MDSFKLNSKINIVSIIIVFMLSTDQFITSNAKLFHKTHHKNRFQNHFKKKPHRKLILDDDADSNSSCVSAFPTLCKFVDALPIPTSIDVSTGNIQVIGAYKILHKFHRDLPETQLYGYGPKLETASSPGPTLEAKFGVPTQIQWENHLDGEEIIPVDPTLNWANPKDRSIPIVTHLHGSASESTSDGHPEAWFTFKGEKGPTYNKSLYTYKNMQQPAELWYHDHTYGITRTHVYSGLAGLYFIRDAAVEDSFHWPSAKYEIPLVMQDKLLNASGKLFYASIGANPAIHPLWSPEVLFDFISVNGKLWPYVDVEKRQYRLRLLNAANGRFFNMRFIALRSGSDYGNGPITAVGEPPSGTNLTFHQIGTDAGYLDKPVEIDQLLLAPAERADLIVDFSKLPDDQTWDIYLTNSAIFPYPGPGTPPDSNTVVLMKFVARGLRVMPVPLPPKLVYIPPLDVRALTVADKTRYIILKAFSDTVTGFPLGAYLGNLPFSAPATETPIADSTEVWTIVNLNNDAHPIHIHLVRHRIVNRRRFDPYGYLNNTCSLTDPSLPSCWFGDDVPLAPGEMGWKDTSVAFPFMTTSLIMKFAEEDGRMFPFDVSEAPGYVWHCHVLEHEDNELMRPVKIIK